MNFKLQNNELSSKALTILTFSSMSAYFFYSSIAFGYFLSKIFYNLFETINKNENSLGLVKPIQLRKKLHFQTRIKIIINFCWKRIQNWFLRIFQKSLLLSGALNRLGKAIQIFLKVLKSPFRFKHNFRRFKILVSLFWKAFLVFSSFIHEIFFFHNIVKWLIQCGDLIRVLMRLLMKESRSYALYFILLGLFGVLVGFLLGLYRKNHEDIEQLYLLYLFFLLLLFNILSQQDISYLLDSSLAPKTAETFDKFSLQPLPKIEARPFKFILDDQKQKQIPQIPFPISKDMIIDIDFMVVSIEEPIRNKFLTRRKLRYLKQVSQLR